MHIYMQTLTISVHAIMNRLIPESSDMRFHAARKVSQKFLIRTVDTFVLVLAIAFFGRLGVQGLWIAAIW